MENKKEHQAQKNYSAGETREVIYRLFATLQMIYRDRFIRAADNPSNVMNLWQHYLSDITTDQIEAAMEALPEEYPSHPPTVGEFTKLVRKLDTRQPGNAIEHDGVVCGICHSHALSQHHADTCLTNGSM